MTRSAPASRCGGVRSARPMTLMTAPAAAATPTGLSSTTTRARGGTFMGAAAWGNGYGVGLAGGHVLDAEDVIAESISQPGQGRFDRVTGSGRSDADPVSVGHDVVNAPRPRARAPTLSRPTRGRRACVVPADRTPWTWLPRTSQTDGPSRAASSPNGLERNRPLLPNRCDA